MELHIRSLPARAGHSKNASIVRTNFLFPDGKDFIMMRARTLKNPEADFIMNRSVIHAMPPRTATAAVAAVFFVATSVNLQANELQVGRYSLYAATPTEAQRDLLSANITVRFPEEIQTVGEAVRYLLERSGYRLATTESIGPDAMALFALPLPAAHQQLGPMTLRVALETLGGPAFNLVQDPVHRLITYERCALDGLGDANAVRQMAEEVEKDED